MADREALAKKAPQYITALSATIGALATGIVLGWMSPIGLKFSQKEAYDFDVSSDESSWVGSTMNLGAAAMCYPSSLLMDKLGRKKTMLLLVIPFTVGWLLLLLAQNVTMLIIGRFVTGIAAGSVCVTVPAYNSEITTDSIRGQAGVFFQFMITVGILFSYAVGSYTSVVVFNICCLIIPIIFAVVVVFMPESPKYLVYVGKVDAARKSLVRLRGNKYDVDYELNMLKQKAEEHRNNKVPFSKAIRGKAPVKAIIICYALMVFQQLSGINAVIFNTSTIFDSAGAAVDPPIATIIIGVIQVFATIVSVSIVDKRGRKFLLVVSASSMSLCSIALGVFFYLKEDGQSVDSIALLPIISLSLFIIGFNMGLGPIPWMMAGELCLIDMKAFIASTAGTLNWLLSFLVTNTFSLLNTAIGSGATFWIFAGIMIFAVFFTMVFIPETKGKSIDEVQILLAGRK